MNEEQKKKDIEEFNSAVAELGKQFPNHTIKEYTLSHTEQELMAEQATIKTLAQTALDIILNEVVLRRIGITPSPDVVVRYHIGLGRFVCMTPKEEKKK